MALLLVAAAVAQSKGNRLFFKPLLSSIFLFHSAKKNKGFDTFLRWIVSYLKMEIRRPSQVLKDSFYPLSVGHQVSLESAILISCCCCCCSCLPYEEKLWPSPSNQPSSQTGLTAMPQTPQCLVFTRQAHATTHTCARRVIDELCCDNLLISSIPG